MKKTSLLIILLLSCSLLAGTAQASDYYADFGGQPGMTILVDKFVTRLLADKRIADYFATTNVPKLKQQLAIQFCQELNGPCKYAGLSMAKVHNDLGVTKSAFNALAEDLVSAMNDQNIPLEAQNALMVKLAPMEHDVVTQ
ncbi:MAG TPA: group 1 truncated hemoglobin [Gammaproteobacteria bacterium]|jgi:hemoglobin